jgi:hypothetical protein
VMSDITPDLLVLVGMLVLLVGFALLDGGR